MDNAQAVDPVTQDLNDLIPNNLDGIIRENRDLVELALSTDDEIKTLYAIIPAKYAIKDILDDWRLISLRNKKSGQAQLLLLGRSQNENISWLTSPIIQIDLASNCVMTKSLSKYELGFTGKGEPPREQLLHICATFHRWGSGTFLGIPHFFY